MPTARSAAVRITLRRALVALGFVLVGVNVASAVWDIRADRERTELRARRELSNLSALLAEQTAGAMEAVDLVLRDAVQDGSADRAAAITPRLREAMVHIPQVAAFLVVDAQGNVVGRTNETPSFVRSQADRPFFAAHRDGATGLFLSDPYLGQAGAKWRFMMTRRLNLPGGAFGGVVAALMEVENFDRLYRTIELGDGGFINLTNRDGMVITRVPDPQEARGRKFPNPQINDTVDRAGRFTGWTVSPIIGQRVLLSMVAVRGFALRVTVGATEEAVLAPWRGEAWRITVRTLLTSGAMLALIALAALGLDHRERALQRERRLAEVEHTRLERRLRQAEKMEAVGRLAGGIAHDFNNILGGILGYGEMLVEETPAGSRLKRYAQNVLTAANRARDLVEQILAYSSSQRGQRAAVDLGRIVAETLDLVRGSLAVGVRLQTHLPSAPVPVMGNATQLHQVAMNLCTNALQAMDGTGELTVSLTSIDLAAERVFQHGTLAPGSYVSLTVKDSGPGMDEATLARIFEPFFTTKEVGKGTGLGLSLVYGIVTDSGGAIDVVSETGRGSAFTITLPRAGAPEEVALGHGPIATDNEIIQALRGRGESVLVVDDEEALLAVTAEVLLRLGYRPCAFSDARQALAAVEADAARFNAVITDEVMPHLTGTELAQRLRRHRADLPIVLVSGYIGPMMAERAAAAGIAEILKKPVQSRELASALARALAKPRSRIKVAAS
ncbi:MAG TPA: ATP-binding protein [Burkholderiales bacterium]|jgi:signal transduction histidine kinase/CheY-like chemotaxis protein|nr:ATP-binding protein [Burkholderiales bacterium]